MVNAPVDPSPPMGGGLPPIGPGGRTPPERISVDSVSDLVAARERAGMTSADIVSLLKMAPRQVDALERGDWAALPGLAFVRGVLRSYGRAVGVSVDPLLASLDSGAKASELRPSTSLQEPLPSKSMLGFGSGGSGSKTTWVFLAAILLIALALFFGRDTDFSRIPSLLQSTSKPAPDAPSGGGTGGGSRTTVESIPVLPQPSGAPQTPTAPAGSTPGTGAPGGAPSSSPGSALPPGSGAMPGASSAAGGGSAAGVSTALASPTAPGMPGGPGVSATAPGSGVAAGAAQVGSGGALRLVFERESWVEIKQDDGRVLLYGQQKAGSEAQIPLAAALSLTIGNSDHVRLERDGKPVDLKAASRQGVARLKLNP